MSIRATTTHIDKYGVTHRIDLLKAGYVGSSTEMRGTSGFINFSHDNLNEDVVFRTPVMSGRLDVGLWVETSGQRTVIDEVMLSLPGDFTIEWYQGGVLFWRGIVEPDFTTLEEGAFPYVATLMARDIPSLAGYAYPGSLERLRAIAILASALNASGLNLPIRTRTSWVCEGTNTAQDFLRQVYVNELNLRDFADNTNLTTTATPWTMRRVVDEMARAFKLFIRQTDGVWLVEQMSAHANPSSVLETQYTSAGVFVSDSNVNPTVTANSVVRVVTGSNRMSSPTVAEVRSTYDHRSRNFGILFQPVYVLTGGSQTFAQSFVVDGTQNINLTGTVQVRLDTPTPDSAFIDEPYVNVMIRVGSLWWNGREWATSEDFTRVRLFGESSGFIVRDGGEETRQFFAGAINITTDTVPTDLTAGDTLTVTIFTAVTPVGNSTRYNGLALRINNADDEKQSRAIIYELSRGGTGTFIYDDGVSFFGSGPTTYSPGALTSSDVAPDPLANSLIINWQRRGTTPDRIMAVNLLKEVLDQMRGYRYTLEAVMKSGGYTPYRTLSYDGAMWMYIGGRYNGYEGEWTAVFKQNALATGVDVSVTLLEAPGANVTQGLLQTVQSARNEAIEGAGIDGMRLALEASGSISQLTVFDRAGTVQVKEGQTLRIVNPVTLEGEEVVATSDRSGSVINVTPVTLEYTYPKGSYVFLSQESVSAGIVLGENAVRIYAEGQSLGRLTADVNGTVTSIDVNLYTRVLRGMEMRVVNSQTGAVYAVTADQDEAGPGEVTLDIEEQVIYARAGDVLAGDNSFQQSQITVTQGLIVLKVNSNGRVAQIRLGADDLGSEIDISAEQVNINGIVFTEGTVSPAVPGDIKTSNYVAGSAGWKIDGNGSAEFNDVTVRGTIEWPDGLIDNDGIDLDLLTQGSVTDGAKIKWGAIEMYGQIVGVSNSFVIDVPTALGASEMIVDCENISLQGNVDVQDLLTAPNVGVTVITNASSPYTVLNARYIATNSTGGAITVNLPTGTDGRILTVFDTNGTAGTNNITINRASTDTINGGTSTTLTTNYQSVTLIFNAGNWTII